MGYNLDFEYLFNFPREVICPECNKKITGLLEEHDIDCGTTHEDNTWAMHVDCPHCEEEFKVTIECSYKFMLNDEEIKEKQKCGECGDDLESEDEVKFGQCDKCCAWKYRENSK